MPGPAAAWSGLGLPCRRQHFSLISGTQSQDDGRMKWRAKRERRRGEYSERSDDEDVEDDAAASCGD